MKVLITGASGFVGGHAVSVFSEAGWTVLKQDIAGDEGTRCFDICRQDPLIDLIRTERPDACLHLAGMSFVPDGWKRPAEMCRINLLGTVNLLEAFRSEAAEASLLLASTANVYQTVDVHDDLSGKVHFQPSNPYSISKLAADLTMLSYADRHGMRAMTARPVSHIGPGQSPRFVVPSFARQLKMIAAGRQKPVLKVGNMSSRRDFMDVRDVARAYLMLIESGAPGSHYNIATGRLVAIKTVLAEMCSIADVEPEIETDPDLYRPTDSSPILDTEPLRKATGWEPRFTLSQSLRDIYASTNIQ